jgi:hypothetical protein
MGNSLTVHAPPVKVELVALLREVVDRCLLSSLNACLRVYIDTTQGSLLDRTEFRKVFGALIHDPGAVFDALVEVFPGTGRPEIEATVVFALIILVARKIPTQSRVEALISAYRKEFIGAEAVRSKLTPAPPPASPSATKAAPEPFSDDELDSIRPDHARPRRPAFGSDFRYSAPNDEEKLRVATASLRSRALRGRRKSLGHQHQHRTVTSPQATVPLMIRGNEVWDMFRFASDAVGYALRLRQTFPAAFTVRALEQLVREALDLQPSVRVVEQSEEEEDGEASRDPSEREMVLLNGLELDAEDKAKDLDEEFSGVILTIRRLKRWSVLSPSLERLIATINAIVDQLLGRDSNLAAMVGGGALFSGTASMDAAIGPIMASAKRVQKAGVHAFTSGSAELLLDAPVSLLAKPLHPRGASELNGFPKVLSSASNRWALRLLARSATVEASLFDVGAKASPDMVFPPNKRTPSLYIDSIVLNSPEPVALEIRKILGFPPGAQGPVAHLVEGAPPWIRAALDPSQERGTDRQILERVIQAQTSSQAPPPPAEADTPRAKTTRFGEHSMEESLMQAIVARATPAHGSAASITTADSRAAMLATPVSSPRSLRKGTSNRSGTPAGLPPSAAAKSFLTSMSSFRQSAIVTAALATTSSEGVLLQLPAPAWAGGGLPPTKSFPASEVLAQCPRAHSLLNGEADLEGAILPQPTQAALLFAPRCAVLFEDSKVAEAHIAIKADAASASSRRPIGTAPAIAAARRTPPSTSPIRQRSVDPATASRRPVSRGEDSLGSCAGLLSVRRLARTLFHAIATKLQAVRRDLDHQYWDALAKRSEAEELRLSRLAKLIANREDRPGGVVSSTRGRGARSRRVIGRASSKPHPTSTRSSQSVESESDFTPSDAEADPFSFSEASELEQYVASVLGPIPALVPRGDDPPAPALNPGMEKQLNLLHDLLPLPPVPRPPYTPPDPASPSAASPRALLSALPISDLAALLSKMWAEWGKCPSWRALSADWRGEEIPVDDHEELAALAPSGLRAAALVTKLHEAQDRRLELHGGWKPSTFADQQSVSSFSDTDDDDDDNDHDDDETTAVGIAEPSSPPLKDRVKRTRRRLSVADRAAVGIAMAAVAGGSTNPSSVQANNGVVASRMQRESERAILQAGVARWSPLMPDQAMVSAWTALASSDEAVVVCADTTTAAGRSHPEALIGPLHALRLLHEAPLLTLRKSHGHSLAEAGLGHWALDLPSDASALPWKRAVDAWRWPREDAFFVALRSDGKSFLRACATSFNISEASLDHDDSTTRATTRPPTSSRIPRKLSGEVSLVPLSDLSSEQCIASTPSGEAILEGHRLGHLVAEAGRRLKKPIPAQSASPSPRGGGGSPARSRRGSARSSISLPTIPRVKPPSTHGRAARRAARRAMRTRFLCLSCHEKAQALTIPHTATLVEAFLAMIIRGLPSIAVVQAAPSDTVDTEEAAAALEAARVQDAWLRRWVALRTVAGGVSSSDARAAVMAGLPPWLRNRLPSLEPKNATAAVGKPRPPQPSQRRGSIGTAARPALAASGDSVPIAFNPTIVPSSALSSLASDARAGGMGWRLWGPPQLPLQYPPMVTASLDRGPLVFCKPGGGSHTTETYPCHPRLAADDVLRSHSAAKQAPQSLVQSVLSGMPLHFSEHSPFPASRFSAAAPKTPRVAGAAKALKALSAPKEAAYRSTRVSDALSPSLTEADALLEALFQGPAIRRTALSWSAADSPAPSSDAPWPSALADLQSLKPRDEPQEAESPRSAGRRNSGVSVDSTLVSKGFGEWGGSEALRWEDREKDLRKAAPDASGTFLGVLRLEHLLAFADATADDFATSLLQPVGAFLGVSTPHCPRLAKCGMAGPPVSKAGGWTPAAALPRPMLEPHAAAALVAEALDARKAAEQAQKQVSEARDPDSRNRVDRTVSPPAVGQIIAGVLRRPVSIESSSSDPWEVSAESLTKLQHEAESLAQAADTAARRVGILDAAKHAAVTSYSTGAHWTWEPTAASHAAMYAYGGLAMGRTRLPPTLCSHATLLRCSPAAYPGKASVAHQQATQTAVVGVSNKGVALGAGNDTPVGTHPESCCARLHESISDIIERMLITRSHELFIVAHEGEAEALGWNHTNDSAVVQPSGRRRSSGASPINQYRTASGPPAYPHLSLWQVGALAALGYTGRDGGALVRGNQASSRRIARVAAAAVAEGLCPPVDVAAAPTGVWGNDPLGQASSFRTRDPRLRVVGVITVQEVLRYAMTLSSIHRARSTARQASVHGVSGFVPSRSFMFMTQGAKLPPANVPLPAAYEAVLGRPPQGEGADRLAKIAGITKPNPPGLAVAPPGSIARLAQEEWLRAHENEASGAGGKVSKAVGAVRQVFFATALARSIKQQPKRPTAVAARS